MYSVEEEGGVHFITMELVHGKTLADVLSRGALSPSRFFELAVPLADAVAAAHSEEGYSTRVVARWSVNRVPVGAGRGTFRLWRTQRAGGEAEPFSEGPGYNGRFSPNGKMFYFTSWGTERAENLWAKSLQDGREYPVTDFEGRRGNLGWDLATDGQYLYFTWGEDLGDIWVMDAASD